jgi:hypothetical protein
MSQLLIGHSPDLKQLRDEGFEIEVKGGYLLIHHIPYVNSSKEIKYGTLVSELTLASNSKTAPPNTHVINFIGEHPCEKDGSLILGIKHSTQDQTLIEGVTVNHSFSNKPPEGYPDYYRKVVRYAEIISAPAKSLNKSVTEKTFRVIADTDDNSVFHYIDTNSSRANINLINDKLKGQKVAIIGLGGTGAYILDLIAKSPVNEIHLYDGDLFLVHNAFRSPGAASIDDLENRKLKTDFYANIYSKMHKRIYSHSYYITEVNVDELSQMSFVFIAIDKDSIKKRLFESLIKAGVPFIDVGLGVNVVDDCLIGSVRVTLSTPEKNDHLPSRISCGDDENNDYATNIQIAELNAINANYAVLKWKKWCGFYQDLRKEYHLSYTINVSQLTNDDVAA